MQIHSVEMPTRREDTKCIYPEEAETWVGNELAHNVDKKLKLAKAIEFLPSSSKWKIQFGNGETILISYDQFCRGKKWLYTMSDNQKQNIAWIYIHKHKHDLYRKHSMTDKTARTGGICSYLHLKAQKLLQWVLPYLIMGWVSCQQRAIEE